MNFSAIDKKIKALEVCIKKTVPVKPDEKLYVGIDLGTAYIVVVVLNSNKEPVACALEFAQVVRDGLVVDYTGASQVVKKLVAELEQRLGRKLTHGAIAVPPGTGKKECATHCYVVESAGLEVTKTLDEPTAANSVLGIKDGIIVDIGGGTTGLSILENGKVVYVADEATGGTHLTLVLAGNYNIDIAEAEKIKKQKSRHQEILPIITPVLQKMATIIHNHIQGRAVTEICLVGGTCCLTGMEKVIADELDLEVSKPANPFLVTPLGIALNCYE